MKTKKILSDAQIESEFARFEYMAKQRGVMDHEIIDDIINLFETSDYFRTPYKLSPPTVFRARTATVPSLADAEAKFDRVAKLTYPSGPAADYIGQGRCNKARNAVFYCTNENGVPIFEVHPKVGDYIALSQFRNRGTGPVTFQAPMIGVKQIREILVKRDIAAGWQKMLEGDWLFLTQHKHLIKIDELLTEWFLKAVDSTNRHFYRLTTIIYKIMTEHTLYGGNVLMDGLIYPSVASQITGVNFALKTDLVGANFDFFGAILYHYERDNADNRMELRLVKQAWAHEITDEDKLNWRIIDPSINNLLVISPDMRPSEFPQFDPAEFVAKVKAFPSTH